MGVPYLLYYFNAIQIFNTSDGSSVLVTPRNNSAFYFFTRACIDIYESHKRQKELADRQLEVHDTTIQIANALKACDR